jgi:hypothetical protein
VFRPAQPLWGRRLRPETKRSEFRIYLPPPGSTNPFERLTVGRELSETHCDLRAQSSQPYHEEKRGAPRFPWTAEISGVVSSELGVTEQPQTVLHGLAKNIAIGGIGIMGDRPIAPGTVLRCEISIQEAPVHIPTLLKVCWSDDIEANGQYKLGLLFLF